MARPQSPLGRQILADIGQHGPIGVDVFMARALFDSQWGYYKQASPIGAPKSGKGDFITSPEISQMFGELIGLWLAQTWQDMGKPAPFHLVETGPGRGTLMADILRATAKVAGFHANMRLGLVETNPVLRACQAERLAAFAPIFYDDLGAIPDGPLLLVGNEFLDCMPVQQYCYQGGRWHEVLVGIDGDGFTRGLGPATNISFGDHWPAPYAGAIAETCPALANIAYTLRARRSALVMLQIDYGRLTAEYGDTVQALRAHQKVDIFEDIGNCDLTAHVDFDAFARLLTAPSADNAPLKNIGMTSQGAFLTQLGIYARAQMLARQNPDQASAIQIALQRLVGPEQMGTLFKVFAASNMEDLPMLGFDQIAPTQEGI